LPLPSMTTAERDNISSPSAGMTIYNSTTNEINYYDGSSWQVIGLDGKVKADSGDSTAGYLDSKVDNATIEVDTSNHQLRVKDGGIARVKLVNYTAGDYLIASADTEKEVYSDTYTKAKEILVAREGTLRIKFDLKEGTGYAWAKIYRNGSPVGTERSWDEPNYVTFSEDISGWSPGDLCQLYVHSSGGQSVMIRNFRIYTGKPIVEIVTQD